MRRLLSFVLHAVAAGGMTLGFIDLINSPEVAPLFQKKGGYFRYLTNQGLIVALACMLIGLFNDVSPSVQATRHVKRTLMIVALPLGHIVTCIYWSLLIFVPHLILPPEQTSDTPAAGMARPAGLSLPTDIAVHALPFLALAVDFFVFEPKYSKTQMRKVAPVAAIAFTTWYAALSEYCAVYNGEFPYPFLTLSSFPVRVLIYAAVAATALGCFRVLNALHV